MTAIAGAPGASSPATNARPRIGTAPNTVKISALPFVAGTCSAWPPAMIAAVPEVIAVIDSNVRDWLAQSTKFAGATENVGQPRCRLFSNRMTRRSLCGNGNGCSTTALTTLKMAVVAPMPSASVSRATAVKLGCCRSNRSAYRRSCPELVMNLDAKRYACQLSREPGSPCLSVSWRLNCLVQASIRSVRIRPPRVPMPPAVLNPRACYDPALPRCRSSASRIASAISRLDRRRCRLCRWMVRYASSSLMPRSRWRMPFARSTTLRVSSRSDS